MPTIKKIKAGTPVNKKITRTEEAEEGTPSLALKKRIPTAFKVRKEMMKKK